MSFNSRVIQTKRNSRKSENPFASPQCRRKFLKKSKEKLMEVREYPKNEGTKILKILLCDSLVSRIS